MPRESTSWLCDPSPPGAGWQTFQDLCAPTTAMELQAPRAPTHGARASHSPPLFQISGTRMSDACTSPDTPWQCSLLEAAKLGHKSDTNLRDEAGSAPIKTWLLKKSHGDLHPPSSRVNLSGSFITASEHFRFPSFSLSSFFSPLFHVVHAEYLIFMSPW